MANNFSELAKSIIEKHLSTPSGKSSKSKVNFEVALGLKDPGRDGVVSTLGFNFTKPLSEDLVKSKLPGLLQSVSESFVDTSGNLDVIDRIMGTLVSKKTSNVFKGNVFISLEDAIEGDNSTDAVRAATGRFVSPSNMRNILELMAKEYLIKDMKAAGAPLKFRTGRFANSLRITSLNIRKNAEGSMPTMDLGYNYMTRPYSVFNPAVSTYRRLSLRPYPGARNPQALIGAAIAKAAKQLLHSKYNINIRQGI